MSQEIPKSIVFKFEHNTRAFTRYTLPVECDDEGILSFEVPVFEYSVLKKSETDPSKMEQNWFAITAPRDVKIYAGSVKNASQIISTAGYNVLEPILRKHFPIFANSTAFDQQVVILCLCLWFQNQAFSVSGLLEEIQQYATLRRSRLIPDSYAFIWIILGILARDFQPEVVAEAAPVVAPAIAPVVRYTSCGKPIPASYKGPIEKYNPKFVKKKQAPKKVVSNIGAE